MWRWNACSSCYDDPSRSRSRCPSQKNWMTISNFNLKADCPGSGVWQSVCCGCEVRPLQPKAGQGGRVALTFHSFHLPRSSSLGRCTLLEWAPRTPPTAWQMATSWSPPWATGPRRMGRATSSSSTARLSSLKASGSRIRRTRENLGKGLFGFNIFYLVRGILLDSEKLK